MSKRKNLTEFTEEEIKHQTRSSPNITWNHVWPTNETQDALSDSEFRRVPTEILFKIFRYLSVRDLCGVSSVCRTFKMVADQDEIWKYKSPTLAKPSSKSFKQIYMEWMHGKYLRNIELDIVENNYRIRSRRVACGIRCGPPQFPARPQGPQKFSPIGGFKEHPNSSQEMIIKLSVNIDDTARELIKLLERASKYQKEWRQSAVVQQMITRYYRFMKLKSSLPSNTLLIPTLDIEIIWQTHLLRPTIYRDDCLRLFHRIIDHSLLTNEAEQYFKEQAFIDTCRLYEEQFNELYCPLPTKNETEATPPKYVHPVFGKLKCLIPIYSYWDKTVYEFSSNLPTNFENPFSFTEADVILDSNWLDLCKSFMKEMLRKVHVEEYRMNMLKDIDLRSSAIQRLKKSYERFLYMAAKYPPSNGYGFVHPTYAIDIIWHSHMQEPIKYTADCVHLVGHVIDHAPWPSVGDDKMKASCNDTNNNWKQEFKTEMSTDHLYNTVEKVYDRWDD